MRISDWSSDVCSSDLGADESVTMRISVLALGAALISQPSQILAADESETPDKVPILVTASRAEEPLTIDRYAGSASVIRSEERRVGKECGSTCSSRWAPDH